ncbi:DUF3710 domain-containing protein [Marinitenerispora sediminis]|uniref:DUF3710 domain-containing protein n=1 Tax=Marinitenerispora sediminis TaxID=1931232 RepID=A0A368T3L7_9ACTN|nr:DUF3710 domain-containing protein [Marinitenerispora sediminis]RCV49479.1 DUF3710 domain-containing protein [Marinitenerispora sediminis]RCV57008.1 DUF3710 domain-containing protein [Marinitenerispora sediminis]RCV58644.1 DUF3710 domain-containing protein [Marinitenerispora sediminis]
MFGRRRKKSEQNGAGDPAEVVERPSTVSEPAKSDDRFRAQGPWDASEAAPETQRVDLGGLLVPFGPDIEVQMNVAKPHNRVIGVTVVNGRTSLQVQPFAAPKSSGLWDEVREEISAEITQAGGKVEDFEGTFGPELRAIIPVPGKTTEQGRQLGQPARFIGVDGPRWFLRGVIRGEGATQPAVAARIEEIFQNIVVVRGDLPIPPRELLELKLPPQARPVGTAAAPGRHERPAAPAPAGTGEPGGDGAASED